LESKKECVSDKLPEVFGVADEINFELKRMVRTIEEQISIQGFKMHPL
jgi:hypothetical protein